MQAQHFAPQVLTLHSNPCSNSWYKQSMAVLTSCSFNAWIPEMTKKEGLKPGRITSILFLFNPLITSFICSFAYEQFTESIMLITSTGVHWYAISH